MKIIEQENFLLTQLCRKSNNPTVKVVASHDDALSLWNASTRLSPIYKIEGFKNSKLSSFTFPGRKYLLFLGPVHPEKILRCCNQEYHIWITIGLYNLLVVPPNKVELNKILKLAKREAVPYEFWEINSGTVKKIENWLPDQSTAGWRKSVVELSQIKFTDELKEAIREYCPLIASTISRSNVLPNEISKELEQVNQLFAEVLTEFTNPPSLEHSYRYLSELLTINAGLSRFSSQTFAGSSPILNRECHLWSNSLLGIGVATIALWNIRGFIDKTLGAARWPERFNALKEIDKDIPDLARHYPPDRDYMWDIKLDNKTSKPIIPLIPYFSSRDGYRSTTTTISAPLASVTSCNCPRWSLMTLTHEISHVIIRAILADLIPDLSNGSEIDACITLSEGNERGKNLFDEIRRIFFRSVYKMAEVSSGLSGADEDGIDILNVLRHMRHDIDETMVHTFDFLYFYGKDIDKYVSGIWASWGVIPNVSTRVQEYVVRTICAVLSLHLRNNIDAPDIAKDRVRKSLSSLQQSDLGGRYIDEALHIIDNRWDEIKEIVQARRQLVKIVNCFLFSENLSTKIRTELKISGGASDKDGYTLNLKTIELNTINNPLRFIEAYTSYKQNKHPSAAISTWFLYVLAFCIED